MWLKLLGLILCTTSVRALYGFESSLNLWNVFLIIAELVTIYLGIVFLSSKVKSLTDMLKDRVICWVFFVDCGFRSIIAGVDLNNNFNFLIEYGLVLLIYVGLFLYSVKLIFYRSELSEKDNQDRFRG